MNKQEKRKKIAIGVEDFKRIIDKNGYFVDKTLMIQKLIESEAMVTLFTRPRRFGKTLNQFMIRRFFEDERTEKGEKIDALISGPLIKNIFFKNSPLHDGAIVIANGRIAAAKCVLPSTEREVPMEFGMRHRAALGASEATDALVIVVSEERGSISIARKGHISQDITPAHLRILLRKGLSV